MEKEDSIVWVASFDIGKKNFAFCIEEFDEDELLAIKNIPKNLRYNANGTPTQKMSEILKDVYMNGKIILHKNFDLTKNCNPKQKLDTETFHNMVDVLDHFVEYWDQCKAFVIEEQMSFGKKINKMALALGQHCYSYFAIKYGRYKTPMFFHAYNKTQVLGAEQVEGKPYKSGKKRYKAMEKPQRKKWAVKRCLEIFEERGEKEIIDEMNGKKKLDDLADTFLQLMAWKYLVYVDKSV